MRCPILLMSLVMKHLILLLLLIGCEDLVPDDGKMDWINPGYLPGLTPTLGPMPDAGPYTFIECRTQELTFGDGCRATYTKCPNGVLGYANKRCPRPDSDQDTYAPSDDAGSAISTVVCEVSTVDAGPGCVETRVVCPDIFTVHAKRRCIGASEDGGT